MARKHTARRNARRGNFPTNLKKGALHKSLGIPQSKEIPTSLLKRLAKVPVGKEFTYKGKKRRMTATLKRRITFALNAKTGKFKPGRRK